MGLSTIYFVDLKLYVVYYSISQFDKNIGFDERATHTLVSDQREGKIETNPIFPITHPNDIVVDREAVEITNIENHLFLTAIDFIKIRIKDLIKNTYKRIRC